MSTITRFRAALADDWITPKAVMTTAPVSARLAHIALPSSVPITPEKLLTAKSQLTIIPVYQAESGGRAN
jgi:hypothetical protein